MAHHAYLVTGDIGEGVARAEAFAAKDAEVVTLRYGQLSVDDARSLAEVASRSSLRDERVIIVAASRLYHEAQNALLKLFEEPPAGTTIVLVVPSEGDVIATLRSRLVPLPRVSSGTKTDMIYHISLAKEFAEGSAAAREKIVARILDRAKSDKQEEKQAARADALSLAEGLARIAYDAKADHVFLRELDTFIPILHERAAPLKPILEHILITAPGKAALQ